MNNKEIDELIRFHEAAKEFNEDGTAEKTVQALRELKQLKEQGAFEDGLRRAAEIVEERSKFWHRDELVNWSAGAEQVKQAILNEADK